MPALDAVLKARSEALAKDALARQIKPATRGEHARVTRDDESYISFSCNDYLGLSHHPDVKAAAAEATALYGAGAGASRLVTGSNPLYAELESLLAAQKGTESACVFGSGYLASIGSITALMQEEDLIIADKYVHACMIDGAQLSGASFKRFAHNDMAHLELLLKQHRGQYRHCLILTETVFSMDGDVAPLAQMAALAQRYDSWLLTDDAHGLGVINATSPADIQLGTLSKAAGSYGGYVCGSKALIEYLQQASRSLIFTTGLPPAVLGASIAALRLIESSPALCDEPLRKARLFTQLTGLPPAQSAIVPLVLGSSQAALDASQKLKESGFLVMAIRPPTVPNGTARLRFAFSALHTDDDITRLAALVRDYGWVINTEYQRLDTAV